MAIIGNSPSTQSFTPAVDYFSGNAVATAFTLSRPVASVAQIQVVIEDVPQNPSSAYTVNGNTITFTSAPPSGTNNIYVYYTSPNNSLVQPGQATVNTAQIANGVTINFGDGSASAPSITNWGDSNTGIFFPAEDTIAFAEGGVESIRIDANGNLGIGTASPVSRLTVNGEATLLGSGVEGGQLNFANPDNLSTGMVIDIGGADVGRIYSARNNSTLVLGQLIGTGGIIASYTAGTERMRITSNGGIAFGGASNFGTSGQFLRSNGDAAPTWATPSGGFTQMQVYTSGSGAWTIPAGITNCKITVVGGGGNGGANGNANTFGGGGGGGGAAIRYYTGLTPGNTINYTVGGATGTSSVSSGTQTITGISATGGSSGGATAAGSGGAGSGGNLNVEGSDGGIGGGSQSPSDGGASIFGGGGTRAAAGNNYGGGGGGVVTGSTAGAGGVVIIEF